MKNKKLFIIGAGASKDIDKNMPLNKDILIELKNLRLYLFLELLELVTKKVISQISDVNNKLRKLSLPLHLRKSCQNSEQNDIYFSLLEELNLMFNDESIPDYTTYFENHISFFIEKFIENLLLNCGLIFKDKKTMLNIREKVEKHILQNTCKADNGPLLNYSLGYAIYRICNFKFLTASLNSLNSKDLIDVNFNMFLNSILEFIFEKPSEHKDSNEENIDLIDKVKTLTKEHIINTTILSNLIRQFSEDIYSVDFLLNLHNHTLYSEEYAKAFNLPNKYTLERFVLIEITRYINDLCNNINTEHSWINYIEKLSMDAELEFINFNYDTLINKHIRNNPLFNNSYNSEHFEAILKKLITKINTSHIYGKISTSHKAPEFSSYLPYYYLDSILININTYVNSLWDKRVGTVILRDMINYENFKSDISTIKLIRVNQNKILDENIIKKIVDCNDIYILGFGFDKWNLENIGLYGKNKQIIENKTIYITNYGDFPKIRLIIEDVFNVRLYKESETEELSEDGKKVTKYAFWRSNKEDKNKVFVSTKPVYKALNEDFNI